MFKYAWWKSGYITEKVPTPVEYCFNNVDDNCKICNVIAVIKCAWCTIPLCMSSNKESSGLGCVREW